MHRLCEQSVEVAREHVRWMMKNKIAPNDLFKSLGSPIFAEENGISSSRMWEFVEDCVRQSWQNAIYALERRSQTAGER